MDWAWNVMGRLLLASAVLFVLVMLGAAIDVVGL